MATTSRIFVIFVIAIAIAESLFLGMFLVGDEVVHCFADHSEGTTACFGWGVQSGLWASVWRQAFDIFPDTLPRGSPEADPRPAEPPRYERVYEVIRALESDLASAGYAALSRFANVTGTLRIWWEQLSPMGAECECGPTTDPDVPLCLCKGSTEATGAGRCILRWICERLAAIWVWCNPADWLRQLLVIAGIEPNPGPRWDREAKAAVRKARKQQQRLAEKERSLKRSRNQKVKEALMQGVEPDPGPETKVSDPVQGPKPKGKGKAPASSQEHDITKPGAAAAAAEWADVFDGPAETPAPESCKWWGGIAVAVSSEAKTCKNCGGALFKVHRDKKKKGVFVGWHVGDPKHDKHLSTAGGDVDPPSDSPSDPPSSQDGDGPTPPPGGPTTPPTTPPATARPAAPTIPLPMLRGYVASAEDLKILARRFSCWRFAITHEGYRWDPTVHDERLVIDRNVARIAQPLQLARIIMRSRVPTPVLVTMAVLGLMSLWPCAATALARALFVAYALLPRATWGVDAHGREPWMALLGSVVEVLTTFTPILAAVRFTAYAVSCWGLYRVARTAMTREKCIDYCPHMVSCALAEYSNGTSMEVARTNARLKLNRLACLPIEDRVHHPVIAGSEEVLMTALETYHFFVAGPGLGATLGPL